MVYFGCPQQQAITFFTNTWGGRYPKVGDNLAEWLLELVVQADRSKEVEVAAKRYAESELAKVRGRKRNKHGVTAAEATVSSSARFSTLEPG
jgi:hypothetical protein